MGCTINFWFLSRNGRLSEHEACLLGPSSYSQSWDYIFGGGCIAVDSRLAAIFWVLDND